MSKETYTPWDSAEFLGDDEVVVEYLRAALEENDPAFFVKAVGNVARAKGMSQVAQETQLGRQNLYKALSGERNPRIGTLMKVLDSLGVQLTVAPSRCEDVEKRQVHAMTFRFCGDDPELLRRRIIRLADDLSQQTGLKSMEDTFLGGRMLYRPGRIAERVGIWVPHEEPRWRLRVNLWPASTAGQADRFRKDCFLNMCRHEEFLSLNEQGWTVEPNLNFSSLMGQKFFWAATTCGTRAYLNYFFSGRPYGNYRYETPYPSKRLLLPLIEQWERKGILGPEDRNKIERTRGDRTVINVNLEFSVYRDWCPDDVIELDEQGCLEAHIIEALAIPLATWGEELERPCSAAASAKPT